MIDISIESNRCNIRSLLFTSSSPNSGFYEQLGHFAKSKGVVISVLSIKGSECKLESLGALTEITSGKVDRVDPLEITKNFQSILSLPVIAVSGNQNNNTNPILIDNIISLSILSSTYMFSFLSIYLSIYLYLPLAVLVNVTVVLHKGLYIRSDAEDDVLADNNVPTTTTATNNDNNNNSKIKSSEVRDIGNVTRESNLTFEYGIRSNFKKEEFNQLKALPFQLQIRYTRLDGMKCMRTISKSQPVTFDRKVAEDRANIEGI